MCDVTMCDVTLMVFGRYVHSGPRQPSYYGRIGSKMADITSGLEGPEEGHSLEVILHAKLSTHYWALSRQYALLPPAVSTHYWAHSRQQVLRPFLLVHTIGPTLVGQCCAHSCWYALLRPLSSASAAPIRVGTHYCVLLSTL